MPDPIRGRWTLEPYEDDPQRVRRLMAYDPDDLYGESVEVVPVPDEQAIERAERHVEAILRPYSSVLSPEIVAEQIVVAVLAALEQPE